MKMVLTLKLGLRIFRFKNYLYYYTCEKLCVVLKTFVSFKGGLGFKF